MWSSDHVSHHTEGSLNQPVVCVRDCCEALEDVGESRPERETYGRWLLASLRGPSAHTLGPVRSEAFVQAHSKAQTPDCTYAGAGTVHSHSAATGCLDSAGGQHHCAAARHHCLPDGLPYPDQPGGCRPRGAEPAGTWAGGG